MEAVIGAHPLLKGVLMFGRERNQVGVLVEPSVSLDRSDLEWLAKFRNELWPYVEKANKDAPAFSRIFKEMILVATPEKPLLRSPKGTVMKAATLREYETEIGMLYEAVESSGSMSSAQPPEDWSEETLIEWLQKQCQDISDGRQLHAEEDLFVQGFDRSVVLLHRTMQY